MRIVSYVSIGLAMSLAFAQTHAQNLPTQLFQIEQLKSASDPDDTLSFSRALASGKIYRLAPQKTYVISSCVMGTTSGSGLEGDGTAIVYMPASAFNNTSLEKRYTSNSCGFFFRGSLSDPNRPVEDITLRGFKIVSEVKPGRVIDAITARNVRSLHLSELEISGFPIAVGLRLSTISGNSWVQNNKIHDFFDDSVWGTQPQSTAIEVDGDRVAGASSDGVIIDSNQIADLVLGPTVTAQWGYQTDGINLGVGDQHFIVRGNRIRNVGEGIDLFSNHNVIADNVISDVGLICVKLAHGASYNVVVGNTCTRAGISGISISATPESSSHYNQIIGNNISDVDPNNVFAPTAQPTMRFAPALTSCIQLNDYGLPQVSDQNMIANNVCNPGSRGQYAWLVRTRGQNFWLANFGSRGTAGYVHGAVTGTMRPANPTSIVVEQSKAQNFGGSIGDAKVTYDVVANDSRGEWDSANLRWRCQIPGFYSIQAGVNFAAISPKSQVTLTIRVNGSPMRKKVFVDSAGGSFQIQTTLKVETSQYIEVSAELDDPSVRETTVNTAQSYFIINSVQ